MVVKIEGVYRRKKKILVNNYQLTQQIRWLQIKGQSPESIIRKNRVTVPVKNGDVFLWVTLMNVPYHKDDRGPKADHWQEDENADS